MLKNSKSAASLFSDVVILNTAFFYISGRFPTLAKRFTALIYKSIVKIKPHSFQYDKIGYLMIAKAVLSLILFTKNVYSTYV